VTNLFKIGALVNFDEERLNTIFSERLEEQLKDLIVGILVSFADQAKEI
jgi:hypothetical protein